MKLLASLAIAISLAGCAFFQQYSEPVTKVDPVVCTTLPEAAKAVCKEAGDSIVKGYATLAGYNGQIAKKKSAGIYTQEYAQGLLNKSIAARKELDKARDVFDSGKYADALSQSGVVDILISSLEKELNKQVAKEQK